MYIFKKIIDYFNPHKDCYSWFKWLALNKSVISDNQDCFVLDAGCGTGYGSALRQFRNCRRVGCDIDQNCINHTYLDYWIACSVEDLSIKKESFQFITCNWVLEHVSNPQKMLKEINRVLKSGGKFIFRTPNIYNYAIFLSSRTPTIFHHWVRKLNASSDQEHIENVPTLYKINTRRKVRKLLMKTGFDIEDLHYESGACEYLRFFLPFFFIGRIGELITNVFFLRWLKKDIVCVAKKL